ncbi:MAG: HypC/HybG/HupF family hydrogenase formation chaperone [Dysgonamonadaceae bacterium]|jgi:hydrogenase expression/formation protein HypC|nr:HypC/HybG/HupF family hydrogenase formation chaperone [Dysgonamonadaceae bacterium]
MCLAIPGKILSIDASVPELKMARVDFGGVIKNVCVQWLESVGEGDYILAHAGMAISQVDEQHAQQTLADFEAIAQSLETQQ